MFEPRGVSDGAPPPGSGVGAGSSPARLPSFSKSSGGLVADGDASPCSLRSAVCLISWTIGLNLVGCAGDSPVRAAGGLRGSETEEDGDHQEGVSRGRPGPAVGGTSRPE